MPRNVYPRLAIPLISSLLLLAAPTAHAQGNAGGASFQIDTSVRAAGMGRASAATFWGDDLNWWSNPGLQGYHHGIRFEHGRTQLVPDLADDVYLRTNRVTLGAWGVGVTLSGKPINKIGGTRLDYGESVITEPGNPDPVGTFRSWEDVSAFGVGVNVVELLDNATRLAGGRPANLHDWFDVSAGITAKHLFVDLAPAVVGSDGQDARGAVDEHDRGYLIRVTPYNSLGGRAGWPALDRALHPIIGGWRADLAYGESRLNHDGHTIALIDIRQADPMPQYNIRGLSARVAVGLPGGLTDRWNANGHGWLTALLTPLVSFGKAWDREQLNVFDTESGSLQRGPTTRKEGWELTLANIYTIRRGHVNEPNGQIFGNTDGWGLGFRLGDLAAFRYDRATIPQYVELGRVTRQAWQVSFDPLAIWQVAHGRPIAEANRHF